MAGVIFDRRNWIFLIALVPAVVVGLALTYWPKRYVPPFPVHNEQQAAPVQPAASAPAPAPASNKPLKHRAGKISAKAALPPPDFTVKTALQIDRPLGPGDYVWDDSGVPPGRVAIVVDIKNELIYVYRGGDEIGRSTLIYGDDDKPTPIGVFPILQKNADHYSKTYGGAPMPHMMRLTPDGVALHGSRYIHPDYATHGCIGLPRKFAAILFREAKLGDYVKITNGWNPAE